MTVNTLSSATLLVGWCTILVAQERTNRPSDAEITRLLVGNWSQKQKVKEIEIRAKDSFFKDGTWQSEGTLTIGEKVVKIAMTGKWKIREGFLIQVVETCKPPTLKKGHESKDEVVSVSSKEMKCRTKSGAEIIRIRVP